MSAAVVIPALNEAATVGAIVRQAARYAVPFVVDDGSTDGTGSEAEAAGATVIRHPTNLGYDAALRSGFAAAFAAGFGVIASIDADAELDPSYLRDLVEPILHDEASLAIGVRSGSARWSESVFRLYARARFGVPDLLCGAKAFSSTVYERWSSAMDADSIGTGLAVAALRGGVRPVLVPVAVRARPGPTRFGGGLRANVRILRALVRHCRADIAGSRVRGARGTR